MTLTQEERDLWKEMNVGFVRYCFRSIMETHTNASIEDVFKAINDLSKRHKNVVEYSDIVEIAKEFYPHFAGRIDKLMVLI